MALPCGSTEQRAGPEEMVLSAFTLNDLEEVVARRAKVSPEESWTAKLVAGGQTKAAKKLGEEAVETVIAALAQDRKDLVSESADLVYHLMVVLNIAGIPLQDVLDELERRTGQSGLREKAGRTNS
jgi:phosphoribosyl-ATP pyrophosphohydrolase